MRKKIVIGLLVFICFILQCTVFRSLSFGGIGPNLLIILTSALGFMEGKKAGTIIGFCCGFLVDIFFGQALGFYALIYMYIGYTNGHFRKIFYPEDLKLPIVLITASDFAYCLITYILLFLLRGKFNFGFYFRKIILPEIVYTIGVTIILYPIILLINRYFDKIDKRSAKKFV